MSARLFRVCGLSLAIAGIMIAGCPTNGDGTGDGNGDGTGGTKELTGTWTGTINCTTTQAVGGAAGTPRSSTETVTIEFDADGQPVSISVGGYSSAPDQAAALQTVGETATLNATVGGSNITLVVTVRSAAYTSTSARITLDLQYNATTGAATSSGTGVQTIEAVVNGSSLTYNVTVEYDVAISNPNLNQPIETSETVMCSGTLTRQ